MFRKKQKPKNLGDKPKPQEKTNKQKALQLIFFSTLISVYGWSFNEISGSIDRNKRNPKTESHPNIEQMIRAGDIEGMKNVCFTDDSIYRLKHSLPEAKLKPISNEDYEKLSQSIEFDDNYDKTKLKQIIDDIQKTTGVEILLELDPNDKVKRPVQNLVDQLINFKTITTSYGQRTLVNKLQISNGLIKSDNHDGVQPAAYFSQRGETLIATSLENSGFQDTQTTFIHELHHNGYAGNINSARLCKMYIEFKSEGVSDEQFKKIFSRISELENDPSILVQKAKFDFIAKDKKLSTITFKDQTSDFGFIFNQYIAPYVFEGSKLDFRNYYYYYGFSDLSKSIAEKLHAELSTELLAEHSIN
ncbi:MAG: hypothetical protein ACRCXZ_01940, partial [Patescibacteria group bacterium]